ncbi:MAG: hypothetical protein HY429_02620, partial [Candidatus Levybacteria bacterium]|nr:hypothetical protein [Candidatus Levybacteria bacterium]
MVGPEVAVLDRPAEAPKPAVPEPAPSPNGSSSEAGTAAQEPQEPQEDQSAPIATDTDAAPTTPDATANREDELPSEGSAQGASETEVPAQPGNRERVEMVATVILASQVVGARAAMKGKPPEAFADPANQGKLALLGYGAIAQLQGENNLDLFGGETITVTVKDEVTGEDKQYIVKQVNQGDGDTLQCEVEGQTDLQPLSRQAVLNAYFLAEA